MGGYNKSTGIYDLTITRAAFWLRRSDIPESCARQSGMAFYSCLLHYHGLEVICVADTYLRVKATPEDVWEVLSNQIEYA